GGRNAGTPLEIASTPVSAAQPDENDRIIRNANANPVIECAAVTGTVDVAASRLLPRMKMRKKPQPTIASTEIMNAYVGIGKAVPASRIPRRFNAARTATSVSATPTGWSRANGQAAPMFATPEETDTATVST